ncbi:colicin immunity domain-containing protein [Stenotrophomonas sp. PS02289]|uniref:colicin immunity domain-containing protein n=1 Tax=Stenotrophomonas sp. PS02289 TaxID=2991422 RepID=UPI00249C2CE9|nr:colicin immunity domain-containing protein [Stenotrophomonas sp. PS02289]
MSEQTLLDFAQRFVRGRMGADVFSIAYIELYKQEMESGRAMAYPDGASECISSMFCIADAYVPGGGGRLPGELDDKGLEREIATLLRLLELGRLPSPGDGTGLELPVADEGTLELDLNELVTTQLGYQAMVIFLERYYDRADADVELGEVMGAISNYMWTDGMPNDPAMWGDWLVAVELAKLQPELPSRG